MSSAAGESRRLYDRAERGGACRALADSAADADYRIVADTGSTDDTVERLSRVGVTVHKIAVKPWRFDVARNTAMG